MTRAPNRSARSARLPWLVPAALAALSLVISVACSRDAGSSTGAGSSASAGATASTPSTSVPPTLTTFPTPTAAPGGSSPGSTGGTGPTTRRVLDGFEEVTVNVRRPDGTVSQYCLLLAATEAQRERGLMQVSDPSLGGHPGMLFLYEKDDTGAFWMKDTLLPLSIAFVSADGAVVSSTDMEPCPAGTTTCPNYPARAPYRYAIEVPKGRLGAVGLDQPENRLSIGPRSCPSG